MWHLAWITYSTLYRCSSTTPNPRYPSCIRDTGNCCVNPWTPPVWSTLEACLHSVKRRPLPITTSHPTRPASKDILRPFPSSRYTDLAFTPLHLPTFLALLDRLKYRRVLLLGCHLRSHPPTPILQLGQDSLFRQLWYWRYVFSPSPLLPAGRQYHHRPSDKILLAVRNQINR